MLSTGVFQNKMSPNSRKILMTGAAGQIGCSLRQHLAPQYHFRCLDQQPIPDAEDLVTADILDFQAVLAATKGVEAVIHLAANPSPEQPWQDVYTSGIAGTYNVFEAARKAGVQKIIYASTNHVIADWEGQKKQISPEMPIRPDSLYGVGKAFGEALGCFYADEYNLSIICLRIGSFKAEPQFSSVNERSAKIWCSPRDLAQLVSKCLEQDHLGFQIFHAVSNNQEGYLDFSNAQRLVGYQPQDDSRYHLKQ
jgi:uronate dehydrogenase